MILIPHNWHNSTPSGVRKDCINGMVTFFKISDCIFVRFCSPSPTALLIGVLNCLDILYSVIYLEPEQERQATDLVNLSGKTKGLPELQNNKTTKQPVNQVRNLKVEQLKHEIKYSYLLHSAQKT